MTTYHSEHPLDLLVCATASKTGDKDGNAGNDEEQNHCALVDGDTHLHDDDDDGDGEEEEYDGDDGDGENGHENGDNDDQKDGNVGDTEKDNHPDTCLYFC